MTTLFALAPGSVDPRTLFCCCCAAPAILAAVAAAGYGLIRNSTWPTVLAGLALGLVGALILAAYASPDPSPVYVIDGEEVVDPDMVAENEAFRTTLRVALWWWVASAVVVGVLAARLVDQRSRDRSGHVPPTPPAGPDAAALG